MRLDRRGERFHLGHLEDGSFFGVVDAGAADRAPGLRQDVILDGGVQDGAE